MPTVTLAQPSFAKGELAPILHGRIDIAAYAVGLATARNFFIHSSGGASNRAGTEYLAMCKDHTYAPRLIPFSFKTSDAYQIEAGNLYMRFIRNGAHVLESDKTITAATAANPVVITSAAHGYANGDDVEISGVVGMTRLNGRRFRVANKTTNTFELTDVVSGSNIDGSAFSAYVSGGIAARVYTITTPYVTADLDDLKYTQSADVMTLTHEDYEPRELSRTAHTSWTLAVITFAPAIGTPASVTASVISGTGTNYTYKATAIDRETFEESLPGTSNTVSGGATPNNSITWSAVTGAGRYAVYRLQNGVYGLLGETETTTFVDNNLTPDLAISPPAARNPFNSATDYPGVCGYYEQRRVFGATIDQPDTIWYTQTGNHKNLNVSTPQQDDDAITATLNSEEVNQIRGFSSGNDLLVFTSGQEFRVNSGSDSAFSISTLKQKPQSSWGASHLRPIKAGTTTLFCEENNARIRSFGYSLNIDGYTGNELSLLASHLFDENYIVDWAYQHSPERIIYMCRDDGELLKLTFNSEQEVIAWAHSDTAGKFERVSVTRRSPDSQEDQVHFVVRRRINGQTVRYVERLHSRVFSDVRDCFFVDCGLSLDAPVTITDVTEANPVVVTAASHGFSNGDEVDIFDVVWEADEDDDGNETQPDQLNTRRYVVASATANTFALTDADGNNINGTAFNAYVEGGTVREAVLTVSGLDHLEGQAVAILSDGNVVSGKTVANGAITLPRKASRVHVGKRFIADLETLNIEAPSQTIQGKLKKIPGATVKFTKSRGMLYGPSSDDLTEMKQRENELMGDPTDLLTGEKKVTFPPHWNSEGRIFIRQRDPLPITILALIPELTVGA